MILKKHMYICTYVENLKHTCYIKLRVSKPLSIKGQRVYILGFVGYTISTTTTQFHCCSAKEKHPSVSQFTCLVVSQSLQPYKLQ